MDVKGYHKMRDDYVTQRELLKTALEATDAYLGIEKHAVANKMATDNMIHDFTYHMSRAHDALQTLGVLNDHEDYMRGHVETMMKLSRHDDKTIADLPYTHIPKADYGDLPESVVSNIKNKSSLLNVDSSVLFEEYKAQFTKTKSENVALAFVNKLAFKLSEEAKEEKEEDEDEIDDDEMEKLATNLQWEDIEDLYGDEEFENEDEDDEKEIEESISVQGRIKKKQAFARFKGRRNVVKRMKLRRASDLPTLQRRAKLAARRALYKRFLRGRNKSQLSAAEKDRIESQVARLKTIQSTLAQKMLPKIRKIEQKRIAGYRTKASTKK